MHNMKPNVDAESLLVEILQTQNTVLNIDELFNWPQNFIWTGEC